MPISLLKNINKLLFVFLLLVLPVYSYADTAAEFPYNIDRREKEAILLYNFAEVWDAALKVLEDMDKAPEKMAQEKMFDEGSVKKKILSDKDSGLIIQYTAYSEGGPSSLEYMFIAYTLLIKSVEDNKTKVFSHITTYYKYNVPFDKRGIPGSTPIGYCSLCLAYDVTEETILKNIENKLKEKK